MVSDCVRVVFIHKCLIVFPASFSSKGDNCIICYSSLVVEQPIETASLGLTWLLFLNLRQLTLFAFRHGLFHRQGWGHLLRRQVATKPRARTATMKLQ